jgi:hypothetical protein
MKKTEVHLATLDTCKACGLPNAMQPYFDHANQTEEFTCVACGHRAPGEDLVGIVAMAAYIQELLVRGRRWAGAA